MCSNTWVYCPYHVGYLSHRPGNVKFSPKDECNTTATRPCQRSLRSLTVTQPGSRCHADLFYLSRLQRGCPLVTLVVARIAVEWSGMTFESQSNRICKQRRSHSGFANARVSQTKTQLSLTNRATHLCKCNGVADLKTRPSPYVLQCRISSFCVKGCTHKHRRTPKIGDPWNSALLGRKWLTPRYTPPTHVLPRQIW